eukprot:4823288-Amphidinium_carterae.3
MRTLANRNEHASRAVLNAACGGLWMGDRRERVFQIEQDSQCPYCGEAEGSASHTLYDCPALEAQRKQAAVPAPRDDVPKCVRVLGLGTLFPSPLPCPEEASSGRTKDDVLFTDGSGKHPTEPTHRRCGSDAASREAPPSFPTPSQDAGNHARLQGSGRIVTDCKGAAVVANKLKTGLRVPRGRHSRID